MSPLVKAPTLRPAFSQLKARVYKAWTGLRWMWLTSLPDARSACGYQLLESTDFIFALLALDQGIALRQQSGPWCDPLLADEHWIEER